ncbi:MAG: NAD(P)-dependent dehydrogenase (short-subunit alcohol dehydrogenase family) [Halieaceae bacterium]|jgi:NAD(P)-dependent dehydrogenase (short-subunit alcohol dehydrogenase family)
MSKGLFDLSGKVALVTGGNSGLGLGFARGIAKQGGDVVIWGRSQEKNTIAVDELQALGVRASARAVDVSSQDEVIAGFEALMAEYGRIDTVIANAGMPPNTRSILSTSKEDYLTLLGTNMHGAFYTLQEGAKLMVTRAEAGEPGGSLIFCGSLSIFQGVPGIGPYAAAKGGISAALRCMAVELGQFGIRANTIAPGYVKSGFAGGTQDGKILPEEEWNDIDKLFAGKGAIKRPGFPEDFEGVAAYLASDASRWHSGDTIVIDGASLIHI